MKVLKVLAVLLALFMVVSPAMADEPDDPIGAGPVGQGSGEEVLVAQQAECIVTNDGVNDVGFTVCFQGVSADGLTWTYSLTSDNVRTTRALSHWVFGVCMEPTSVSITGFGANGGYQQSSIHTDPTTGVNGFKFDAVGDGLGDGAQVQTSTFAFTFAEVYAPTQVTVATKAGQQDVRSDQWPGFGTITGPDTDAACEGTTAIALKSFTTEVQGKTVVINWETAAEIDNAGFNIYRANALNGQYEKINGLMIGAQGGLTGGVYSYEDTPPADGVYFYVLEDVDFYGVATSYEPVQASLEVTLPTLAPTYRPMQPAY